ncbi:MAG: OmpA family protein [Spirochaetales bacterium]|nr:OmpA family protein [Spirochaetales bacterium]
MLRKKWIIMIILVSGMQIAFSGEIFRFQYTTGDRFRILSEVNEDVYINGFYSHSAEILNRIAMEIEASDEDGGTISGMFQTSERVFGSGQAYSWGREYPSRFTRDNRGHYNIERQYYMPVVRNVPIFPEGPVEPGESWSFPAHEVHDFRENLGVDEPFIIPVDVKYTYLGPETFEGQEYHLISIDYTIFYQPEFPGGNRVNPNYPVRISGFSNQILYWNLEAGRADAYAEEFDIFFDLLSGNSVEYQGTAGAHVVEALLMDREALAEDITDALAEHGIEDAAVRVDAEGVTIALHNIQFPPDSAFLWDSEKEKLDEISSILAEHSDRDILISGHTAMAGTLEGRHELSRERAQSVGDYLLSTGVRTASQIVIRGWGGEKPLADNNSSEGRRLNRRVEITILEN